MNINKIDVIHHLLLYAAYVFMEIKYPISLVIRQYRYLGVVFDENNLSNSIIP